MRRRVVEVQRFAAKDSRGRHLTVVITAEEMRVDTLHGAGQWERGLLTYRTDAGEPINVDADGTMRLARDRSLLTKL